jgi:hypothetical protein
MLRYYCRESNIKTLPMDRISPIIEPFQEAFEQVRDRFNPISGTTPGGTSLGAEPSSRRDRGRAQTRLPSDSRDQCVPNGAGPAEPDRMPANSDALGLSGPPGPPVPPMLAVGPAPGVPGLPGGR